MTTVSTLRMRLALVVTALAVASVSPVLGAQTPTMQVTVPFGFEVGPTHFAAGIYTLNEPRQHVLSIRGTKGFALMMNAREPNFKPATAGKVVFDRYGNRYFLREVWAKGDIDHLRCPESKTEHQIKKIQQATDRASFATPTSVELALLENPR